MKFSRIQTRLFLSAATALAMALSLGACSRSQHVAGSLSGPVRSGADANVIVAPCPTLVANTFATATPVIATSAMTSQFRSNRIRFEIFGDTGGPLIQDMGPCAASDTPTISFAGGHANVFLHGTTQSITTTGSQLTFGPLVFPGALVEPGVVVAADAVGNVLEIIWTELAGTGVGSPIVRVQLARWNLALVSTSQSYDIVWDMFAEQNGVRMYLKGHAERVNLSGSATPQEGASSPAICPQSLAGTGGTVVTQASTIVQFRSGRLRLEVIGDMASGIMNATGACAAAEPATILYTGGSANMFRAGTTISVTSTGKALTFGPLLFPGVLLEPGVVVAQDANKNVLEIIWPSLMGLPPGPPILRLQLAKWNTWVRSGRMVDATMRFDAVAGDGILASYTAVARNVLVP